MNFKNIKQNYYSVFFFLFFFQRDITKFKPLSSRTSVSVLTGDSFDMQMPEHLNRVSAFTVTAQLHAASLGLVQ